MITEEIFHFKNYVLKFSPPKTREETAILMLHGFPSESFNETKFEKNRDVAAILSKFYGCDSYLHHYDGLGRNKNGTFNFVDSINDSKLLMSILLQKYKELILIGHSWGGAVAINCFKDFHQQISKMILLSPFNIIPDPLILKPILQEAIKECPYILKTKSVEDLIQELNHVKHHLNPREVIQEINYQGDVLVLQARDDKEVSMESTTEFTTLFRGKIKYEILDSDHSFTYNRDSMLQKCKQHLL